MYITPFFIRLETPWLLDSIIWLAPALLYLILSPGIRLLHDFPLIPGGRKTILSTQMVLTLVGLLILILALSLGEFYTGEDTTPVLLCAFFGFLIMDLGLTIIDTLTIEILEDALPTAETDQFYQWTNGWKQFGRVAAYGLASCDALQLGTRYMYYVRSM